MNEAMKNIFTLNLGVRQDERVIVFTDTITPDETPTEEERRRREDLREIARELAEVGRGFCETEYVEYLSGGGHGVEPHEDLWRAAFGESAVVELRKEGILQGILAKTATEDDLARAAALMRQYARMPGAVVALSNYSTTHTRFRKFLTDVGGARYASMPIFERSMLSGAMAVDWKELERRTVSLVAMLTGAERVRITTPLGTEIEFSIEGRPVKADTGILREPGAYGNLPAGEAFLAPLEGTANGRLVLEWAPTRKLLSPLTIEIRDGTARSVDGDDEYADELWAEIEKTPLAGNIAELGIGTNDKATRPDNILETEKILGTVHIALGDNAGFGGMVSVPFHQDFIFYGPTMKALKDGKWVDILVEGRPCF